MTDSKNGWRGCCEDRTGGTPVPLSQYPTIGGEAWGKKKSATKVRTPKGGTGVPPVQGEKISRRHLPHWQREGAVYFLTWRCAKAIVLSEAERDMALSAILHWDKKRWKVYAAVVMPDHVHVLAQPLAKGDGVWELGELLHSVKSYSAHQIGKARKDRRDQGQRSLKRCPGKYFQQEVVAPAAAPSFHGDAVLTRMLL
jgi:REP element-mobilizing transposase RayT